MRSVGGDVVGLGKAGDRRPYRIAGHLGSRSRRNPFGVLEPQCQHVGASGQETVRPSQHRVLLVQDHRRPMPQQAGGKHRCDAGITAEPDDAGRADPRQDAARLHDARGQRTDRLRAAPQAASGDAGAADDVLFASGERRTGQAAGSGIGHQHDPMSACHEFRGQRLGREEMPARSACRDDDRLHRWPSHAGSSRPRRRVSASSMPMPRAMAITEDPP